MDSGHSKMPCAISGTGILLNKPYLGNVLKQIDLVSINFETRSLTKFIKYTSFRLSNCTLRQARVT